MTRLSTAAWIAAAALGLLTPWPGTAGSDSTWEKPAGPSRSEGSYRSAMARGDSYALAAAEQEGIGHGEPANALALRATEAYELASRAAPKAAEPHYRAAEVLYMHFVESLDHPPRAPTERAIRHWNQFERVAPRDPRMESILFRRSLAYTKLGGADNYRKAAADYEGELDLMDRGSAPEEQIARVLSNAAEIYMALGDLDRAITLYYDSIEYMTSSRQLYAYGLAVALDRDGQGAKAREVMRDNGFRQDVLLPSDGSVFFIPAGDEHYYLGLGLETLGHLESAANNFRQFIREQPSSPYVERARHNIREIERRIRAAPKVKKKPGRAAAEVWQ